MQRVNSFPSNAQPAVVAYVHSKSRRADGTFDSYRTQSAAVRVNELAPRGGRAAGNRMSKPTQFEIRFHGRWRRVRLALAAGHRAYFFGRKRDECLTVSLVTA